MGVTSVLYFNTVTLKPMQRWFSFQQLLISLWSADALLKCPLSSRSPRLNLKLLVEIVPFVISGKVLYDLNFVPYLDMRVLVFCIIQNCLHIHWDSTGTEECFLEKSGADPCKGLGLFSLQASCQQHLHVSAISLVQLSVFCALVNFFTSRQSKVDYRLVNDDKNISNHRLISPQIVWSLTAVTPKTLM